MTTAAERLIADVHALAASIAGRVPQMEAGRRVAPELVAELKQIGVFRMLVPPSHGGLEIKFPPSVDVLAALAAADGATGWTAMIGCETPQLFALLPRA